MLYEIYKRFFRNYMGVSPFFSGILILALYGIQWTMLSFIAHVFFPPKTSHIDTLAAWEIVSSVGIIFWVIYCVYMVFIGFKKYELLYTTEKQEKNFAKIKKTLEK